MTTIPAQACRTIVSTIRKSAELTGYSCWPKPTPICWQTCIWIPATPDQIAHGKHLVNDYGCASCHEINGIKRPENFAPELTKIGSKPANQLAFANGVPHTLYDYLRREDQAARAHLGLH